jgi:hypothetical protein
MRPVAFLQLGEKVAIQLACIHYVNKENLALSDSVHRIAQEGRHVHLREIVVHEH